MKTSFIPWLAPVAFAGRRVFAMLAGALLLNLALGFSVAAQDLKTELVPNGHVPGYGKAPFNAPVSFTFTTRNLSASTSVFNVVRTLTLPGQLNNVTVAPQGSYNYNTGVVSLPVISLGPGQSAVTTVSFLLQRPDGVAASGNVSSATAVNDPPGNNASSASIVVRTAQNLGVTLSASGATSISNTNPYHCETVRLQCLFTNGGGLPAISVVPTLTLPPNLNIVSIQRIPNLPASYNPATGVMTLAPRDTLRGSDESSPSAPVGSYYDYVIVRFTVPPTDNTPLSIAASVSSSSPDLPSSSSGAIPDNASLTLQPTPPTADLRTAPTGPASAPAGQPVTYTHTTTNLGSNPALNVTPTLTLTPAPAAGTVTLPAGATYNATTGVVTFAPTTTLQATAGSNLVTNTISFPMPNAPVTVTSNVGSCLRTDNNTPNNSASITTQLPKPLPVELQDFAAQAQGSDALLNWTTASELHNERFEIERSFDARSFERVGAERGQGSSTRPTDYRFTDAGVGHQGHALVYYRLRQVDTDGTASWGPVRAVTFTRLTKGGAKLYPNPTPGRAALDLTELPAGTYQVRILDLMGRQLGAYVFEGARKQPLSVEQLPPGRYVVHVVGPDVNLTLSLARE
ncbi:T9SS type A sorting domain-containing protein [Hymenobacter sp. BT664]|uniref:T9SS type A sorting domain-containing protein n=1 Tax=Hymenobacter montanus TaxID=2771359 RepID=A0A927GKR0_9BACT|nr:T9SS type A sorting domain-containing protein [Hymenobacter montanus]MBD2769827.1 T9SS type A sorting domain-containing protein [Hymenobacter montanus]